jgi:hypothetical protein
MALKVLTQGLRRPVGPVSSESRGGGGLQGMIRFHAITQRAAHRSSRPATLHRSGRTPSALAPARRPAPGRPPRARADMQLSRTPAHTHSSPGDASLPGLSAGPNAPGAACGPPQAGPSAVRPSRPPRHLNQCPRPLPARPSVQHGIVRPGLRRAVCPRARNTQNRTSARRGATGTGAGGSTVRCAQGWLGLPAAAGPSPGLVTVLARLPGPGPVRGYGPLLRAGPGGHRARVLSGGAC